MLSLVVVLAVVTFFPHIKASKVDYTCTYSYIIHIIVYIHTYAHIMYVYRIGLLVMTLVTLMSLHR